MKASVARGGGKSLVLALFAVSVLLEARASALDIGREGPSYVGAAITPSGSKPQSKLWFHDGAWWGSLFSADLRVFRIYRLVPGTGEWVDTGTSIDTRYTSRSDCLSDGDRLYVVSHHFQESGAEGFPLLVFRFSYDRGARKYSLDAGFPVQIANVSAEAVVIARDSRGVLWATWTFGSRVWVTHSLGDDLSWVVPFVLPVNTTDLRPGDIASIVAFGGNRVGVLWSDHVANAFYFSVHADGASGGDWSTPEEIVAGPHQADDHIHLEAASDGRVLAVLKNGLDETWLRVRSKSGAWTGHLVSSSADGWTRSILVLNEEQRRVYVVGMAPVGGGTIYAKSASIDDIRFAPGLGTAVLWDADDPNLQDVTSTKQPVNESTGVVLLASQQTLRSYWYRRVPLDARTSVRPPEGAFSADRVSGAAPLRVRFHDASSGSPTSWFWSFGDGAHSTESDPEHTYVAPGTYTVRLEVTNSAGSDEVTRHDLVQVHVEPMADAFVRDEHERHDHGHEPMLKVRRKKSRSQEESFLKFDLARSEFDGPATLRLYCTDLGRDAEVEIYLVSNDWSEGDLDWHDRPDLPRNPIAASGEFSDRGWVEFDLGDALEGRERVSLAIIAVGRDTKAVFSSREGSHPPELVPSD